VRPGDGFRAKNLGLGGFDVKKYLSSNACSLVILGNVVIGYWCVTTAGMRLADGSGLSGIWGQVSSQPGGGAENHRIAYVIPETSPHRYGKSRSIWDHTVLPSTRQR